MATAPAFAETVPPEWVALYESPTTQAIDPFDYIAGVAIDAEGNVYAAATGEDLTGKAQIVLLKYSPAGVLLWERAFRGGDRAAANGIALDQGGGIYVVGTDRYIIGTPEAPATGADIATLKYDSNGNLLWSARYTQPFDSSDAPADIGVTADGQVCITGFSYNSEGDQDIVTLRYDVDGTELWVRHLDGPAHTDDRAAALALDPAGNVLVTGYTAAFCYIDADDDEVCVTDMTTIKYAPSGDVLWIDNFDGPTGGADRGRDVTVDRYGNVYVTGISVDTGFLPRLVTVKYSRCGRVQWTCFGDEDDDFTGPDSIEVDRHGQVYVAGGRDFSIIKYSRWGRELWKQSLFPGFVAGMGFDREGNVCVGGRTQDDTGTAYAGAKLDPNGNLLWCGLWDRGTGGRQISRDAAVDPDGNIYVGGYSFGTPSGDPAAALVKFGSIPPAPLPVVEVIARRHVAREGQPGRSGTASFVLHRSGATDDELTVRYSLGGSAINGLDYEALSGEAKIAAGQSRTRVEVQPIDDMEIESPERVELRLQADLSSAYRVGRRRSASVCILDNVERRCPWRLWWFGGR